MPGPLMVVPVCQERARGIWPVPWPFGLSEKLDAADAHMHY